MAAAAEERSNHPLAHALVDSARAHGLTWPHAEELHILPGRGLTATVRGYDYMLGNDAQFQESSIPLPQGIPPPEPGVTRLWMAQDRVPAGFFDARDALRRALAVSPRLGPHSLPAVLEEKRTAVVISPLIALMQDQVAQLRQMGIPAVFLNSAVVEADRSEIKRKAMAGDLSC